MNKVKITILDKTPNIIIECNGLFVARYEDSDRLKLDISNKNDAVILNSSNLKIEVDGTIRNILEYTKRGTTFILAK